jgi:hypothetical protein
MVACESRITMLSVSSSSMRRGGTRCSFAQRLLDTLDEARLMELGGGNVDREPRHNQVGCRPAGGLAACLLQDPTVDGGDQAAFLGDGNEAARHDQPAARASPADQRLGAGQRAGRDVDLGLVVKHELVARKRIAQSAFRGECLQRPRVHVARVKAVAVAARALGIVHGRICVADQLAHVSRVVGEHADADARRDLELVIAEDQRLSQHREQLVCDHCQVSRRVDLGQRDHELISAHTRDQVSPPYAAAQPFGDDLEQLVPGGVAHGVVDVLEAIQIDE